MASDPIVKGVIFDLDGTVANTLPVCFEAFRATFRIHANRHFTNEEIAAFFGPSEEGCLQSVLPGDWEAGLATYLREYEGAHELCPAPFDGIVEFLDNLQSRSVPVAMVTGKGVYSTEISLRRLGLAGRFNPVKTGSAIGAIKPQAIREVLAEWNIPPERAVYVGDAPGDVIAAREVGVVPLAAAWAGTADAAALEAATPVALFRTVGELQVWLIERC